MLIRSLYQEHMPECNKVRVHASSFGFPIRGLLRVLSIHFGQTIHLLSFPSPVCHHSPHPNAFSLVYLTLISWQMHLQHLSAHPATITTFHMALESQYWLSDLVSKHAHFQCPYYVLIRNVFLPCHSEGNLSILISAISLFSRLFAIAAVSGPYNYHRLLHNRP